MRQVFRERSSAFRYVVRFFHLLFLPFAFHMSFLMDRDQYMFPLIYSSCIMNLGNSQSLHLVRRDRLRESVRIETKTNGVGR